MNSPSLHIRREALAVIARLALPVLLIFPSQDASALPEPANGPSTGLDAEFFADLVNEDLGERMAEELGRGCEIKRQRASSSFKDTKRGLRRIAARTGWHTLYCDCPVSPAEDGKGLVVDEDACGYVPARDHVQRGVSWEHIMPASRFGNDRPCWSGTGCDRGRGRRCCQRSDACFNLMEGDMHNLAPALMELNEARSNRRFGEIPGEERRFGRCDFEVHADLAEPRPAVRGDVARSYLYMSWRYGILLSDEERSLMLQWNNEDPPDETERSLNEERTRLQGNDNPFVSGWKNPTS